MNEYFKGQQGEEKELNTLLNGFGKKRPAKMTAAKKGKTTKRK
jgi:hypothetical protein